MSLPRATRRFAPTILATALVMLGAALFVWLGVWQLHRADEKQALLTQYASGQQATVELTLENAGKLPRYQQVLAHGHYEPGRQILLDNMPSAHGRPGYRVVTPFALAQGGWLLVDRGWVPLGRTRSDIPDVDVSPRSRTITGRLDGLPRAGVQLADAPLDAADPWPRVLSFPRHATLERALDRKLVTGLVLLDPTQDDGYERVWHARLGFPPQRHVAYAVQWFALAVAAAVIYLVLGFRRARRPPDEPPPVMT